MVNLKEMIGKAAPAFTLPDASGKDYVFDPSSIQGPVVLFFYSQAQTYGCMKEACSFRDAVAKNPLYASQSASPGVTVIGVSGDKVEKQKAFVDENKLTYPVLSDGDGAVRKAYGAPKGLLGLSPGRTTYVIEGGVIKDLYDSVLNFAAHEKFVTKWLAKRAGTAPPPEALETGETGDEPTMGIAPTGDVEAAAIPTADPSAPAV